jgi:NADPH:quinone reductase-like Zn-dependent oxidoreductase
LAETMKAARVHEWGEANNVFIDDVPVPEAQSGEVLIRVRASSINPVDWKAQQGYMQQWLKLPLILGWEVAGEIAALGAGVSGFAVGDPVYAKLGSRGFAQYVNVSTETVAPKPKSLDFQGAATLPVAALTADQALFRHGGLQAGQKVLIQGAAGGVGHFAVQLAKWKGAYVVGTGSAENEAFVRGLGADEYINYHTTRFEDVVKDADLVFDTVGGETLDRSYAAAKQGGIVVTIAGRPDEEKAKAHGVRATGMSSTGKRHELDAMSRLVDAGSVKPTRSAVYSLDQVAAALAKIREGHTRGKMVVEIP